jgi:hypothetical protein
MYTIKLNCPPGALHANSLFRDLLKEVDLQENDFKLVSKFFGHCVWDFQGSDARFIEKRETISEIIQKWQASPPPTSTRDDSVRQLVKKHTHLI